MNARCPECKIKYEDSDNITLILHIQMCQACYSEYFDSIRWEEEGGSNFA